MHIVTVVAYKAAGPLLHHHFNAGPFKLLASSLLTTVVTQQTEAKGHTHTFNPHITLNAFRVLHLGCW